MWYKVKFPFLSELPDWMESRENLGLTNVKLFDDVAFSQSIENDTGFQDVEVLSSVNDDGSTTIKPEDMLVPLSELKPQANTPQDLPATLLTSTTASPQRIVLCMKRVVVPAPSTNGNNASFHGQYQALSIGQPSSLPNTKLVQNVEVAPSLDTPTSTCDADSLINEVVQKIGNEADMDDLLSQLETSCSQVDFSDVSSWGSEPASPVSFPSPVPSAGSLSPSQSTNDFLFHSLLSVSDKKDVPANSQSYADVDLTEKCSHSEVHSDLHIPQTSKSSCTVSTRQTLPYPEDKWASQKAQNEQDALQHTLKKKLEDELLSVPSPVPSAGSLSPNQSGNYSFFHLLSPSDENKEEPANSPSFSVGDFVEDWGHSGVHSYSRSPRKSKSSRKVSTARTLPYPEDRRARKKEQNKQAALRYRQKKKQEDDVILSKIKAEEERQMQLKARYSNLKQELIYLKKIMREVFIVKGVLSEDAFRKK